MTRADPEQTDTLMGERRGVGILGGAISPRKLSSLLWTVKALHLQACSRSFFLKSLVQAKIMDYVITKREGR